MADPITLTISVSDLAASLAKQDAAALATGALDRTQVWYEFLTQEDTRVRPSHRALHGTVWRSGDPNAPVPPLDYGCRCFIRYVAAPGSEAANILPTAPSAPTTQAEAIGTFLDKDPTLTAAGIDWRKLAAQADALDRADRERFLAMSIAKAADMPMGHAREVARMILSQGQARALRAPPLSAEEAAAKATQHADAWPVVDAQAVQAAAQAAAQDAVQASATVKAKAKAIMEAAASGTSLALDKPLALPGVLGWIATNKTSIQTTTRTASPADLAGMIPTVSSLDGADLSAGITGTATTQTPVVAVELPGGTFIVSGHTTAMVALATGTSVPVTIYTAAAIAQAQAVAAAARQAAAQAAKATAVAQAQAQAQAAAAVSKAMGGPDLPPVPATIPPTGKIPTAPHKPWDKPQPSDPGALASWKASHVSIQTQELLATLRPQTQPDLAGKPGRPITADHVEAMVRDPATPGGTFSRDIYRSDVKMRQADESAAIMDGEATTEERMGIRKFTRYWDFIMRRVDMGDTDEQLAAHLRYHKPGDDASDIPDLITKARTYHAAAYAAMARIPARRYEYLYRGHRNLTAAAVASVLGATELDFGSLSSATTNPRTAVGFASATGGRHAMIFRMKNASGLPISAVSQYPDEDEVLISRQHRYRITGYALDTTASAQAPRWIVDLEQMHP